MKIEEMDFEEFMKHADEYFELDNDDLLDMNDDLTSGNPYGAGRYGYIRSSEDWKSLVTGSDARLDPDSNRWFEHISCGYACWRDGVAEQEFDDMYLDDFYRNLPAIGYREAFYDYQYGDTREDVANMLVILTEHYGQQRRTFSFNLDNITMREVEEYLAAIEGWNRTGELNIGSFAGCPQFGRWH